MKKTYSFFKWLKNVSIAKKLYFTVGIMALLIGIELFALFFSINTLSSVRAYVEGEGLWSKAQKDAVYHLFRYGVTHDEEEYHHFNEFMKVPIGDSKTRKELMKDIPDYAIARQGFLEGRNHPDDVDGMIKLFRRFNKVSYISRAIVYWNEAEAIVMQLLPISEKLHKEINSGAPSKEKINKLLNEVNTIAQQVTVSEDNFSYALAEGSRWLENLVLKLLFIIALSVEVTGLLLAISVSRGIQKGLSEIISAAKLFAKGNLNVRAKVFSGDEIGVLAQTFNQMSDGLEQSIHELEQAQKKFEGLLESAPDAIVIMDKDGIIKLVNAQTERLFGYERNDLLRQKIEKLVPDHFLKLSSWYKNKFVDLPKLQGVGIDFVGRKKTGEEFPVEISLSPLKTEEGLLISTALRDVSERKHVKELENKNKELEQFAYIASHDLQEPLSTIKSVITLLEDEYEDKLDKNGEEYIGYLKESVSRMSRLITDILEYSRIGHKGAVENVNCEMVVQEVLHDMNATIVEAKAVIHAERLPIVKGYPVEIRLLFQNLISNAIKFRRQNIIPQVHISSDKKEHTWFFTIKDNGIGIDAKQKDKIFDIFQRLHSTKQYEGTGIGLAHCKKIVELHNGKIWVESEPDKGSEFHFTLPDNE